MIIMMEEEMRDIPGFEGLYAITSRGRVWSHKSKMFMLPQTHKSGYLLVNLYEGKGKTKRCLIHRFVALAFIPNPDNLSDVNHKDENKTNNCVENLEWCSRAYNNSYGTRLQKLHKPVYCEELDVVFDSAKAAAAAVNTDPSAITSCCRGRQKTTRRIPF